MTDKNLKEKIWRALKEVPDPELGISIVDLGLIYKVRRGKDKVEIEMTLTTIGCPLFPLIESSIKERLKKIKGIKDVKIKLCFDPPWTPERLSRKAREKLAIY